MKTDWQQIREMMDTVIDSCEQIETAGFNEEHRSATVEIKGVDYSVQEFLISAWTLPENIRYQIIRERHEAGNDLPYVPEAARILVSMAQAGRGSRHGTRSESYCGNESLVQGLRCTAYDYSHRVGKKNSLTLSFRGIH